MARVGDGNDERGEHDQADQDDGRLHEEQLPNLLPSDLLWLAAGDLLALCRWAGADADIGSVRLAAAVPVAAPLADLVVQTAPGRLAAVSFVGAPPRAGPGRARLTASLLEQHAALLRLHPAARVRHHLVVTHGPRLPERLHDEPSLTVRPLVRHLPSSDPGPLLRAPSLAPLAVLARPGRWRTRQGLLAAALATIAAEPSAPRRRALAFAALTLAAQHLDESTLEEHAKEAAMPVRLEETEAGRAISRRAERRGEAAGRALGRQAGHRDGRAEGEVAGRTQLWAAVLRARFGAAADPARGQVLAAELAGRPDGDAVRAVLGAADLAGVLTFLDRS